jgi:putative Holliday junction resolvase
VALQELCTKDSNGLLQINKRPWEQGLFLWSNFMNLPGFALVTLGIRVVLGKKSSNALFYYFCPLNFKTRELGRIIAIDYGLKRVGVAVTDPLKMIANSLTTVETGKLMDFLSNYFSKEAVECMVVGLPKQMNNQPSESMVYIDEFVKKFKVRFPGMDVVFVDERFTSKMAVQAMVQGGVKKKDRQNKALIDSVSATIILQSYLESLSYKN